MVSFLSLPGEVRNQIYANCLAPSHSVVLIQRDSEEGKVRVLHNTAVGIAGTCKQIHRESIGMMCENKTFVLDSAHQGIFTFFKEVGPYFMAHIKHIAVTNKLLDSLDTLRLSSQQMLSVVSGPPLEPFLNYLVRATQIQSVTVHGAVLSDHDFDILYWYFDMNTPKYESDDAFMDTYVGYDPDTGEDLPADFGDREHCIAKQIYVESSGFIESEREQLQSVLQSHFLEPAMKLTAAPSKLKTIQIRLPYLWAQNEHTQTYNAIHPYNEDFDQKLMRYIYKRLIGGHLRHPSHAYWEQGAKHRSTGFPKTRVVLIWQFCDQTGIRFRNCKADENSWDNPNYRNVWEPYAP